MMERNNNQSNKSLLSTGFLDLFLNIALGFAGLLIIALILISSPDFDKKINPKAEFLVILTWPDYNPNDMDLWIKDPIGNIVSYKKKESGIMNLDRDDLGMSNDIVISGTGKKVINPKNQEILSIRGFLEGTYTVNVFFYYRKYPIASVSDSQYEFNNKNTSIRDDDSSLYKNHNRVDEPVTVTIQLIRVNPYEILISETEIFPDSKVEKTIFNFTLIQQNDLNYNIINVNRDIVRIVEENI